MRGLLNRKVIGDQRGWTRWGVDAGKAGWTAFAAILFVLVAAILIVKTCVAVALFPQPIYCVTPPIR